MTTITEQKQREWIRKHADADIGAAINYHMVVTAALVTTPTAVRLAREMVEVIP